MFAVEGLLASVANAWHDSSTPCMFATNAATLILVARRIALHAFSSFSGTVPENGDLHALHCGAVRQCQPNAARFACGWGVWRRSWWRRRGRRKRGGAAASSDMGLRVAAEEDSYLAPLKIRELILNQSFFGGTKRVPSKVRLMDDLVLAPHVCDLLWKTLQESWEGSLIEKSRKPQKETKECQSSMMRFLLPLKILPLSLRFLLLLLMRFPPLKGFCYT